MTTDRWTAPDLSGQIAVVTGASRGVGRGIADVLADCGAKTYLVSRSARSSPPGRSGTLQDVADGITSRGGEAIVAPCDLRDDEAVGALFERITIEDGHLEILVNNAVAWEHESSEESKAGVAPFMYEPPWHAPRWWWDDNFNVGVRSHWLVTNAAAPLFVKGRRGAVFFTSELRAREPGEQELVLDLRGTIVERMTLLMALHLRPHQVSSILLYPGFTRTDVIERSFEEGSDYFKDWTREQYEEKTCSPHYVGRAAASLVADPKLLDKSGQVITAIDAGAEYGFTDVTGATPIPL